MAHLFTGHLKIVEIYIMKFNATILNRPNIVRFSKLQAKDNNVICNKTVAKLFPALRK